VLLSHVGRVAACFVPIVAPRTDVDHEEVARADTITTLICYSVPKNPVAGVHSGFVSVLANAKRERELDYVSQAKLYHVQNVLHGVDCPGHGAVCLVHHPSLDSLVYALVKHPVAAAGLAVDDSLHHAHVLVVDLRVDVVARVDLVAHPTAQVKELAGTVQVDLDRRFAVV
jgi:hypothetical protein